MNVKQVKTWQLEYVLNNCDQRVQRSDW